MEKRNITVTLNKAKEWFNSGNEALKEIALQAFDKDELTYNFRNITTFKKACEALGLNYNAMFHITKSIATISKASAAMLKLNIIRKALNLGQDLYLTKDPKDSYIYYPYNPFITNNSTYYKSEINSGKMEVIGKIKSEGEEYNILGGFAIAGGAGLGGFCSDYGVGGAYAAFGFLGCATKEIAEHFGKYFGMLITEAKYGDIVDFEIIEVAHYA
ncbi:unknown [Prevotella sp. CAG:1092]|nr:unknown [Prevotella sp. CAG:1092]